MAAFPRNLMNDIIVPFASSIRSFYRRSSPPVRNKRARFFETRTHTTWKAPRSEITYPRGGIVSAIYQSRCRTIKQRPGIRARRFPRRIDRIGRRFGFHDKAKYPAAVKRYSSIGVFLAAHGKLRVRLFRSPSLSRFFSGRFATITRSTRRFARGSLSLRNASANENWRSGKRYKRVVRFSFSLDEAAAHFHHVSQSLLHTGYFTDIALFFYLYRYFGTAWNEFFPWVECTDNGSNYKRAAVRSFRIMRLLLLTSLRKKCTERKEILHNFSRIHLLEFISTSIIL